MATAVENVASPASEVPQPTLMEQLGGKAAIEACVDIFYTAISQDPLLAHFFEGIDMKFQRRKQVMFMSYVFGGPDKYTGRDLYLVHKPLIDEKGLNETHFDLVAGHLIASLQALNVPQNLIDQVLALVATTRPIIFGKVDKQ